MNALLKTKLTAIKTLCERNGVAELFLFGSALSESMTEHSDVDFAVVFKEELSPLERGDAFFDLLEALENILDRKIDLIAYGVIKNPIFKEAIDNTKVSLYAAA